jgi:hexosaminidase
MTYGFGMRPILAALAMIALPANAPPAPSQADLDTLARSIGYRFAILDNHPADCPGGGACFVSTLSLRMPDTLPASLAAGGITVSYSYVAPLIRAESAPFADTFVNGDLHRLALKPCE